MVVHIERTLGVLGLHRYPRITWNTQFQRFTGGDVGHHAFLGTYQGPREGQLSVFLEFHLPQVESQRIEPQEDFLRMWVRGVDPGRHVQVGINPLQEFRWKRFPSGLQPHLRCFPRLRKIRSPHFRRKRVILGSAHP